MLEPARCWRRTVPALSPCPLVFAEQNLERQVLQSQCRRLEAQHYSLSLTAEQLSHSVAVSGAPDPQLLDPRAPNAPNTPRDLSLQNSIPAKLGPCKTPSPQNPIPTKPHPLLSPVTAKPHPLQKPVPAKPSPC